LVPRVTFIFEYGFSNAEAQKRVVHLPMGSGVSTGNFEILEPLWCIQAHFEPPFQALMHVNMLKNFVVKQVKIDVAHNSTTFLFLASVINVKHLRGKQRQKY